MPRGQYKRRDKKQIAHDALLTAIEAYAQVYAEVRLEELARSLLQK